MTNALPIMLKRNEFRSLPPLTLATARAERAHVVVVVGAAGWIVDGTMDVTSAARLARALTRAVKAAREWSSTKGWVS